MLSGNDAQGLGDTMDNETKIITDQLLKRIVRLEKRQTIQEKYIEMIGAEGGGAAGHLKKMSELVNELKSELKKIE